MKQGTTTQWDSRTGFANNQFSRFSASFVKLAARAALVMIATVALTLLASVTQAATFHVTTTADNGNNSSPTAGSLRKAIIDANNNPGPDTIDFNIPGAGVHTITVPTALPGITDPVTLDGYTQPNTVQNSLPISDNAQLFIQITAGAGVTQGLTISAGSSTIRGLIITGFTKANGFGGYGIQLTTKGSNVIAGNFIGIDANGTNAIGNYYGIDIVGSDNNIIGGAQPFSRNLISGNVNIGIVMEGAGAYNNIVSGNFIGTNRNGSGALGNGDTGVFVNGTGTAAAAGEIGEATSGGGNVISGNVSSGIATTGNTTGLKIQGNMIGTDVTGKLAVPNKSYGIAVGSHGSLLVVGGPAAAARNIISGNYYGILVYADTSTVVQNNYIGTDITGKKALGNVSSGIMMMSSSNTIGGGGLNEGNVIAANGAEGIYISGSTSYGTTGSLDFVLGNMIGVGADGITQLGNKTNGVTLAANQGVNNVIGGQGKSRNMIAYNGKAGVSVVAGTTNLISSNGIFSNSGLGIDLGATGADANDAGDGDTGPNNLQNYPVLTSASLINNGLTYVNGTLNSAPNTKYSIEFFQNNAPDPSGYGEGQNYLGTLSVTTDASGNASFTNSFAGLSAGQCLSTTATDPANNTSEFSLCKGIVFNTPGSVQFSSTAYSVGENGGQATVTAKRTGGNFGTVTAQYATVAGGTASLGSDYTAAAGVLSWGDGDAVDKTFKVPVIDNAVAGPNKTVNLQLSNVTNGGTLGSPASAVLTILDDESVPKVSINDVSQMEGNSGTTNFIFTVALSAASSQTIKVDYTTNDVTTNTPSDYHENIGTLIFAPGETSKQIVVLVNGDTQFEPDETFTVTLSNFVNAVGNKISGLGTILNDDSKPSGSSTVNFGQATYAVQEDLTVLNVTVTRSGDSSGTSSVDYQTVDGTAKQKSDFEYAAGTLTFAPGETDKTISVLINEDMLVEGNETFTIALNNGVNALIGAQGTTTVTIVDDASEPPTSPIDDAQAFVYTHYHDFLNREPDQAGLDFWTSQITACGSDAVCADAARANVSAAFYLSIEFQQTGYLLYLMQKESYGTMPKYGAYMRDLQTLSRGVVVGTPLWEMQLATNQQNLADAWVNRPEFKAKFDNMSSTDFVNALYANAGVAPPQTDKDALVARLENANERRSNALLDVANNAAFRQQEQNAAFVLMEYFGYLRRDPDASPDADLSGYNFWLNKLNQFGGSYLDAEMVRAFIISKEYRQRFGQ
jgi:hypothetical protein